MKRFFGYLCLCGCVVGVLAPSAWAAGTFSWEIVATGEAGAVELTPQPPGTTEVTLGPGGIIKTEYFFEAWNPNYPADGPLVEAYQIGPDASTLTNGPGSSLGLAVIPCDNGDDCGGGFNFCTVDGVCAVCEDSIFVDLDRFDWIYFDRITVNAGNCFGLDLGAALVVGDGGADPGPGLRVYLGTLFLQLSEEACGDFTVALNQLETVAAFGGGLELDTDESATLTIHSTGVCAGGACCNMAAGTCVDNVLVGDCPDAWTAGTACAALDPACVAPCFFEFSNPPGCEEGPGFVGIDAGKRRDHDSFLAKCNGAQGLCGADSIDVTFNDACDIDARVFRDSRKWALTQMPAGGPAPPTIPLSGNLPVAGQTVTVLLSGPINTAYWTCISLLADPAQRICLGYLPGDVNGDGRANADDILAAIDVLTDVAPRPLYAIDVDRDGEGAAPDILEVVNVLNGAGSFPDPPDAVMEGWRDCPPQ